MTHPFHMRIVRSDGAVFELGDGTQWVLSMNGMKDWIALDYDVNTSPNVLTDGSSFISSRVKEKDRTLEAVFWGQDRFAARDKAISFFNSRFTFEAHLSYFGRTRWCEGRQIAFDCKISTESTPTSIKWTLLCLTPFLQSEDRNDFSFNDALPMFGFPFVSHVERDSMDGEFLPIGFMASKLIYDGKNTVYNNGDVETFYKIEIQAFGKLENPTVTKDGKHIKLLTNLKAGDVVEIDFETMPTKITINGKNSVNLTSRDSSFTGMVMKTGVNVFSFDVDNKENRGLAQVRIIFTKKYLGV